jgi:hypothetical protein
MKHAPLPTNDKKKVVQVPLPALIPTKKIDAWQITKDYLGPRQNGNIHAEVIVSAFEEDYVLALETRIRARARNPRFGYIVKYMKTNVTRSLDNYRGRAARLPVNLSRLPARVVDAHEWTSPARSSATCCFRWRFIIRTIFAPICC